MPSAATTSASSWEPTHDRLASVRSAAACRRRHIDRRSAVFRRRTPERASHGPSGWAVQRARRRPTILGRNRDHGSGCGGLGRLPGAHARPPRRARLLLGTRRYACAWTSFPPGLRLRVDVERSLHAESGIGLFECHLRHAGTRLAHARLTVYQPPDAAAFLPIPRPIRRKRHRFDAMDTTTILITGSSRGIGHSRWPWRAPDDIVIHCRNRREQAESAARDVVAWDAGPGSCNSTSASVTPRVSRSRPTSPPTAPTTVSCSTPVWRATAPFPP